MLLMEHCNEPGQWFRSKPLVRSPNQAAGYTDAETRILANPTLAKCQGRPKSAVAMLKMDGQSRPSNPNTWHNKRTFLPRRSALNTSTCRDCRLEFQNPKTCRGGVSEHKGKKSSHLGRVRFFIPSFPLPHKCCHCQDDCSGYLTVQKGDSSSTPRHVMLVRGSLTWGIDYRGK
jgi:hypothetical protein